MNFYAFKRSTFGAAFKITWIPSFPGTSVSKDIRRDASNRTPISFTLLLKERVVIDQASSVTKIFSKFFHQSVYR